MRLMVQPAKLGDGNECCAAAAATTAATAYIAPAVNDGHLTFVTVFFESRFSINTLELCFNALVRL